MKILRLMAFLFILLIYYSTNNLASQELLNDCTFKLTGISNDKSYGFTAKNPIKVGGVDKGIGAINERRFLIALRGPNGEKIKYHRIGSCCPFKTKNAFLGNRGFLDLYEVTYEDTKKPIILYINFYDYGELKCPYGFTYIKESSHITEGGHLEDKAGMLNFLGNKALECVKYKEALGYFKKSLGISKKLNHSQSILVNLNSIGEVYNALGQYEMSLFCFEEALKLNRELNVPQNIAINLNSIGMAYYSRGEYEKALNYLNESLKIFRKLKKTQNIAILLNNIGGVYIQLSQNKRALKYLDESLKIFRKLKTTQHIANCLDNIGGVYYQIGQYEKALNYYEESLKISRELESTQNIAILLNNFGRVYHSLGKNKKALTYLEESLMIKKKNNLSPKSIARSLDNIASVFLSQKRYKDAEEKFIDAEKVKKGSGYPGLVDIYLATERFNKALTLLKEMKPRWNVGADYRRQFHTQKGLALEGREMFKEAAHEFLKAVSISEEMRQRIKKRDGFLGAGGFVSRIRSYRGLVSTLSERVINGEKKDEIFTLYGKDITSSAFYFMESTKARVLLESMAESEKKKRKVELPGKLRKKEQNLFDHLSAVETQWEEKYNKGKEVFNELQEIKKKLTDGLNSLIEELRETHPRYAALYYPKPIPPEELPLRENEVIIEYTFGDDASYVFIVRHGSVKKLIKIPVGKEALEEKVKVFMEPLNSKQYWNFSIIKAKELYDVLLSKVLKEVKEDERIIIVPDGILGLLPFDALVIKPGKSVKDSLYVGDKYNLSYYQSASVMAFQRRFNHKKAKKTLFALGNPVFDKKDPRYQAYKQKKSKPTKIAKKAGRYAYRALATRREWGKTGNHDKEGMELSYIPLPETEIEVRAIAKLFGIQPVPPNVLLNVMANETEFRKVDLDKYQYIHFATHADLPGRVQGVQEPFLLLGQVENKGKDDGFLTMSEVLGLKLNADLVVLSACVTGVGKHMEGEGVVNFARAFHYAGAESVVVSLWEVASKETVEYMKIFYDYLKAGKSRIEALRFARKEIKSKYPSPFYWAVFILHGEGGSIKPPPYQPKGKTESKKTISMFKWIIIPVIFVLIMFVFLFRRIRSAK